MTLKSSIKSDAGTVFLRSDDFAETVTYYPHVGFGETETSREIKAIVIRNQIETSSADGGDVVIPVFEVYVKNDSTLGISSSELDTGGDKILIATRIGGTAKKRSIVYLVDQDEGMIQLQCH